MNNPHVRVRSGHPRRRGGFTLAEVMFAVLILGIGLIAVASLFPVAGTIQRDTVDRVMALNIGRSAEATMLGKRIPVAALSTVTDTLVKIPSVDNYFPMADRSFPMSEPIVNSRAFYWVPLVRKDAAKGWQFFVFVMRAVGGEPPSDAAVSNASSGTVSIGGNTFPAGNANAGDLIVTTAGVLSQRISDATNESAWHGVAAGSVSRSMNVITVGQGAVR